MTTSASLTSYVDDRHKEPFGKPVWMAKTTFVWQTADGHTAQTVTLANLNGTIRNVSISISEVTGNPTTNITITDSATGAGTTFSTLADGTAHHKDSSDFDAMLVAGNVVLSVDPSADPGGVTQTLTIIVIIKGD